MTENAQLRLHLDRVTTQLRAHANPAKAPAAAAYLRHLFPLLGVAKPERDEATREFRKYTAHLAAPEVLRVMDALFSEPEREFHYLAISVFEQRWKAFEHEHYNQALLFIDRNSWWDSVDALSTPLGLWLRQRQELLPAYYEKLLSGSMWSRRTAIILQLRWKEATNRTELKNAIARNVGDKEFFIQKAIGWALRDFSRTDPAWVTNTLTELGITGLAAREASKYL